VVGRKLRSPLLSNDVILLNCVDCLDFGEKMTESESGEGLTLSPSLEKRSSVGRPIRLAVVGATGLVGRETLSILAERQFPIKSLRLLASEKSAGQRIDFGDEEPVVEKLEESSFEDVELVFLAAGGGISQKVLPWAAKAGAVCIDKSSVFRMDPDVPLVVPTVNGGQLNGYSKKRLVSTPNCSTIQLVQVLGPLHEKAGLKRVVACTYQAVSGAGRDGIDELEAQVRSLFSFEDIGESNVFGNRIAFNALPSIPGTDAFREDGTSHEEQKMIDESRKILGLPELAIAVTCVRVPVFNGHSEAVHLEFDRPITVEEVRDILEQTPDVMVVDDPARGIYPTAQDAVGQDQTLVGRIRQDLSVPNGIALWIVSDNLRTGAALNAVRIAETLCAEHLG
jgi:aspartate-semialdehyde dehydrogenase